MCCRQQRRCLFVWWCIRLIVFWVGRFFICYWSFCICRHVVCVSFVVLFFLSSLSMTLWPQQLLFHIIFCFMRSSSYSIPSGDPSKQGISWCIRYVFELSACASFRAQLDVRLCAPCVRPPCTALLSCRSGVRNLGRPEALGWMCQPSTMQQLERSRQRVRISYAS